MPRFACFCFFAFSFNALYPVTTFKDAIRHFASPQNGVTLLKESANLLYLASEKITYDDKSKNFFHFMNNALEDFDFARIYNSPFLNLDSTGFKTIALTGKHYKDKYVVSFGKTQALDTFGDTSAEYRMRQNIQPTQTAYTTQIELTTNLAKFDARSFVRLIESLLSIYDAENSIAIKTPRTGFFPQIGAPERHVLDLAAHDFPQTTQLFADVLELKSFVSLKEFNKKRYTEIAIRGHFRMDSIKKQFPHFYEYLRSIKNLFTLELYINDKKGQNLFTAILNTQQEEFFLGFSTANGKILPKNSKGEVAFKDAFSLTEKGSQKLYVAARAFIRVYGLKIDTGYISLFSRYQTYGKNLFISGKITHIPEGKISGALFGVVPTWVIDLSIPSNLQTLMNQFSQTLLKANNGSGTSATLKWVSRNTKANLHASLTTEFLENRFIRIGMKIWVRRFRPNPNVQEDISRFFSKLSQAFLRDLNSF